MIAISVPLPVPKSVAERFRGGLSGSLLDLLWKLLVTVALLVVVGVTATLGTIGAVIAFGIAGALISKDVRNAVGDLYNRQFASVTVNLRAFGDTLAFWR